MKRTIVHLIGAWALVAVAGPSDENARRAAYKARMESLWALEDRIDSTRPQRRDSPARYLNISDNEVREVQLAAFEVLPRSFVSIGTVVTGCPCADGPKCADQVWVVAADKKRSMGLLLSDIDGIWVIGPVQRWWLQRDALAASRESFRSYRDYRKAEEELKLEFPACAALPKKLDRLVNPGAGAAESK